VVCSVSKTEAGIWSETAPYIDLELNIAPSTSGTVTIMRERAITGNTNLYGIRGASPELVRSVIVGHEGLHGFGTGMDRVMAGGDTQLYYRLHQEPYNRAVYDALYR